MRPTSGLAAGIAAPISLNFVPDAQAESSSEAATTTRATVRTFIGALLWLDGQREVLCDGAKRPLDGEVEPDQRFLADDDLALVNTVASDRHDLVPGSVHLAQRDRADELPPRVGAQGRRAASADVRLDFAREPKALSGPRCELGRQLGDRWRARCHEQRDAGEADCERALRHDPSLVGRMGQGVSSTRTIETRSHVV